MKYIGKICEHHPDREGERYRFNKTTVCVDCHALRVKRWRTQNYEYVEKMYFPKTKAGRARFALYQRVSRLRSKARRLGLLEQFDPIRLRANESMPLVMRPGFLSQQLDILHQSMIQLQALEDPKP